MVKRKHKVTREEIAWWIYLVIMVALVIYGFRDSAAAEVLIRAIRGGILTFNGIMIWNNSRNL